MVMDAAALASVEMLPLADITCPIISGNVYVSPDAIERASVIRLLVAGGAPSTKFTEIVAVAPDTFVAVNLSMIVVQATAVY
jgi:hypothetical protein